MGNQIVSLDEAETVTGEPLLQFFRFQHLPDHLRAWSKEFSDLAVSIAIQLPRNDERTAALRKLLEAKDCAVRTILMG